ncbi:hypothetical protein F4777DRAFT_524974 [Nemania sp. FL0916]|nr:hypothetical protein F4777DRAFT_524974 [Nemania sp. FL0916]
MSRESSTILDRHNKTMASILTHFRNMVLAATEPLPTSAAIPQASLNTMTMNNEVSAMIKDVEDLLALTRELKQLWIAGPLRKPGDADEKNLDKEIQNRITKIAENCNLLEELDTKVSQKVAAEQTSIAPEDEEAEREADGSSVAWEDSGSPN